VGQFEKLCKTNGVAFLPSHAIMDHAQIEKVPQEIPAEEKA